VNLLRNELDNSQKMRSVKSGFVAADPDLLKPFLPGDGDKVPDHLLGRIESPRLFRLNKDVPGPAEKASQATSYTVGGGNSSIERSRSESIVLSFLFPSNNLAYLFS